MKLKKLLAVILTVAMILSCVVTSAFAANASIKAGAISNGTVTFTLTVSDSAGIGVIDCVLSATGGTVTSVSCAQTTDVTYNSANGALIVAMPAGETANTMTITIKCSTSASSMTLDAGSMIVGDGPGNELACNDPSPATAKAAPTTTKPTTTKPTTTKPTTTKPTTTKPTTTASTAANLKSLSVDGYSISPKFSAGRTSYNIEVPADFSGKLDVKATPLDSAAKVTITGNDITDGKGTIKVTVKGTDGTTKTYRITVAPPAETTTEAPAEGLKLSTLKVGAGLALDFQPDVLEYTVKVPAGTKSLDVEALIGEVEGATVRVEGADDLAASNNVVKVIVTDADGVETVYTINVVEETPLATAPAATTDDEDKGGLPLWLALMLILLALILGIVIGFLLGKKKAENDYYDDDDDDDTPIFGGSADDADDAPVSSPYSGGMSFNPPSVGGTDYALPYEPAAPVAQDTAPTTPINSADSFIQSAD